MTLKALIDLRVSVLWEHLNKQKLINKEKKEKKPLTMKPGPAQIHKDHKTTNKNTLNILSY